MVKLNSLTLSSLFSIGIAYEKDIGKTAVKISTDTPADILFLKSLFVDNHHPI